MDRLAGLKPGRRVSWRASAGSIKPRNTGAPAVYGAYL